MTRTARSISTLLAAVALLALAAGAQARTYTFGSRLDHEPSNSAPGHNCREDGSDDPTPACTRVAIDPSIAVPGGLRAPRDGTIVKFKVRAGAPGTLTFRLVRLRGQGYDDLVGAWTATGKGAGRGPTVQVLGLGFAEDERDAVETFPANLKVRKGDYLALDSTASSTLYCSGGGANQMIFSPTLGRGWQASTQTDGCELLVQAVMKPARRR
jgi:hypothetical protein